MNRIRLRCIPQQSRGYHNAAPPAKPILGRYKITPVELFRVQPAERCAIRDRAMAQKQGRTAFDVILGDDGLVHPMTGEFYQGRNGASVKPMCSLLQESVRKITGNSPTVWRIPKGTQLPPQLILVHEHWHWYSIQPAQAMTKHKLGWEITYLCRNKAERLSPDTFLSRYWQDGDRVAEEEEEELHQEEDEEDLMAAYRD